MGDAADDIYQSFRLTDERERSYEVVKKKFDDYFMKKKNVIYERAKFNMRRQEEAEPVDAFITALYNLASKCDYGTLNDELIRDRIVVGIRNQSLSEKMQLNETLTLEKAARMARESEAVKKQQPQLREGDKKEVEVIRRNPHRDNTSASQNRSKRISTRNGSAGGRTIPLEENPAQLGHPNALNVVRQDTFIVCVGVLLIILKLGQEATQRTLIVTVTGSFWELLLE